MRRRTTTSFIILLLSFALLPTASMVVAKKGQQKPDEKLVSFTGAFTGSAMLTVEKRGENLAVYGPINLEFSNAFAGFKGNRDDLDSLRITIKSGSVNMFYDFDWYNNETVKARVPLFHLEGSGVSENADESYLIELDAAIYDVIPFRSGKGKKGAIGLEFRGPVWGTNTVTFTMKIEDTS